MAQDLFELVGATIDTQLRVMAVVGEGGFGVVYKAHHLGFGAPVALKVLKLPVGLTPEERELFLRKFEQEAQLMFRLSQSSLNVARPVAVGDLNTPSGAWAPYCVFEWLDGRSLEEDLAQRKAQGDSGRSLEQVKPILDPVVAALEIAHSMGVVHRDIKPANIFIATTPAGSVVKLLDFGIAKVVREGATIGHASIQTTGAVHAFTPGYAAPEQWSKRYGDISTRTDLYSIALVAVELLAGVPALEGEDTAQLMHSTLDPSERPTPRQRGVDIGEAGEQCFSRALSISAKDRHASVTDWWHELLDAVSARLSGSAELARNLPQEVATGQRSGTELAPEPINPELFEFGPVLDFGDGRHMPHIPAAPARPRRERRSSRAMSILFVLGVSGVAAVAGGLARDCMMNSSNNTESRGDFRAAASDPNPSVEIADSSKVPDKVAVPPPSSSGVELEGPDTVPAPIVDDSSKPPSKLRRPKFASDGMLLVPGGSYTFGATGLEGMDGPPYRRTIEAFAIGATEVSVAEYARCVSSGGCREKPVKAWGAGFCNYGSAGRTRHPVNCVSVAQAKQYCEWRRSRLPTNEEWEATARGSDGRPYPWGTAPPSAKLVNACGLECVGFGRRRHQEWKAAYDEDDGSEATAPVGSYPAGVSPFGALDMAGNVWEWVDARHCPASDTDCGSGDGSMVRGGGWDTSSPGRMHAAARSSSAPEVGHEEVGFRCGRFLRPGEVP